MNEIQRRRDDVVVMLCESAKHASGALEGKPWPIGWSIDSYRTNGAPLIYGPDGELFTISPAGIQSYESAVRTLLKEQPIQARWKEEELWGLVANLTCCASTQATPVDMLIKGVARLRKCGPAMVCVGIANVLWNGPPQEVGGIIIGNFGTRWREMTKAGHPVTTAPQGHASSRWMELSELQSRGLEKVGARPLTVAACWTTGQGMLAHDQTTKRLDSLVGLCLIFGKTTAQIAGHRSDFTRNVGPVNRPGLRGLSVDREAITKHLESTRGIDELAAPAHISSEIGAGMSMHWNSADPFPLEVVLSELHAKSAIAKLLIDESVVSRRILVASRWYSTYYWSTEPDDGALALGVALDALIGSKQGLPGRAMAERYGFLEADVNMRATRAKRYSDLYEVRSSVAHGRRDKRLDDRNYLASMATEVRWVARRMLQLIETFNISTEKELEAIFNDFRWGVKHWP